MIRKAAAAIAKLALQLGVPIAAEKLDFGRTPDQVQSDGDPGLDPATPQAVSSRPFVRPWGHRHGKAPKFVLGPEASSCR